MVNGEDTAAAADDQSEEISDYFICCVCLDLLYKPIVLPCGHVCCFWCVSRSMNGVRSSRCPFCRLSYNHFPTICQMLHFLLLKMYPIEYKRREEQILAEEKEMNCFSPQLDFDSCGSHVNQEYDHPRDSGQASTTSLASNSCSKSEEGEPNRDCKQVQLTDVQCSSCNQLLYRPVVLNCGHGYCESCIVGQSDQMLRCQACQLLHPIGSPNVCLDLDHFLEQQFPKEYALRRDAVQLKQAHSESSTRASKEDALHPSIEEEGHLPLGPASDLKVHIGVGCDFCGMFPIIGERYQCKDCVEKIGFDLCGDCYSTRSKQPGRFNQQHTPEHKFELIQPNYPSMMLRLVHEHGTSFSLVNYDNSIEILEDESFDPDADHHEDTLNSSATPDVNIDDAGNQNETESRD